MGGIGVLMGDLRTNMENNDPVVPLIPLRRVMMKLVKGDSVMEKKLTREQVIDLATNLESKLRAFDRADGDLRIFLRDVLDVSPSARSIDDMIDEGRRLIGKYLIESMGG